MRLKWTKQSKLSDLDRHIIEVQKSTRTLLPFMAESHNNLRVRYPWYYKWHLNPIHEFVHWTTATLSTIILVSIISVLMLGDTLRAHASFRVWDMNTSSDYTADAGIEFTGGAAQLQTTQNFTPGTDWIATDGTTSSNWSYRKAITVTNPNATDLTNYQVKIQDSNPDGLVGNWNMDETSGSTVADTSGNDNTGTTTGTTIVDGKFGKARSFNGSSDYAAIPNDEQLTPSVMLYDSTPFLYTDSDEEPA